MRAVERRGHESGELRSEVTYEDLVLLLIALDGASEAAGLVPADALHRLADLAVDGLCNARTELQGSSADFASLRKAATVRRG